VNCLVDQFYFCIDEFFKDVAVDEERKEEYTGIGNYQWNPEDAFLQDQG
jgi:hypothetical protein